MLSSTCFEQPKVHPQEDLYMQFFLVFFPCIRISNLVDVRMCDTQPDVVSIKSVQFVVSY